MWDVWNLRLTDYFWLLIPFLFFFWRHFHSRDSFWCSFYEVREGLVIEALVFGSKSTKRMLVLIIKGNLNMGFGKLNLDFLWKEWSSYVLLKTVISKYLMLPRIYFRGLFFITRDIHCTQQVEQMSKTFQAWCCSTEIVSNSGRSLWIGLKWNFKNVIVYKKPHSCFRPFCFSLLVALKRRLIRNLSSKVCLIEKIGYIWNKFLRSFIPIARRWNALCSW